MLAEAHISSLGYLWSNYTKKKKEKYVLSTDDTRVQSPEAEPTSY